MKPSLRIGLLVLSALALGGIEAAGQEIGGTISARSHSRLDVSAVPIATQARMSRVLGHDQPAYYAKAQGLGGYRMENSGRGVSAEFTSSGVALLTGGERWGVQVSGYGYGHRLRQATPVAPQADANRIEYRRGGLTEWYVNGPLGLEQGFTVERRPGSSRGQALDIELGLTGSLAATVNPDGCGLTLHKNGSAVLRYDGLLATDARGRELPARMELADNRLRLRIDDAKAQYPVTVDPLVQAARLVDPNGAPGDGLGSSVSISEDGSTIVVGAAQSEFELATGPGTAYVFVKPTTGWVSASTFATKLAASNGVLGDAFGYSVAISQDGSTIAVGAPNRDAVYMFVRPTGGWASPSPLHETNEIIGEIGVGITVSLSGDGNILAAGALEDSNGLPGEIEVFATTNGWISLTSAQLTASDGVSLANLGRSVRISADGNTIVAGAPGATIGSNSSQGAAYVFVKSASGWGTSTETAKLTASNGTANAGFGASVAISGDGSTVVVGTPSAQVGGVGGIGTAYVFVRPASGWASSTETAQLTPSDPSAQANDFAVSLAIGSDGGTVVVIRAGGGLVLGAVYVYAKPASGWASSTESTQMTGVVVGFDNSVGLALSKSLVVYRPPLLVIPVGEPTLTLAGSRQGAVSILTGFATSSVGALSLLNLRLSIPAGTTSGPQPVTLTNTGTAPLGIQAVAATGSFSTTQNCVAASPLAPSASCTEYVTGTAGGVGTFAGSLTFTDDAGNVDGSTQQVALSATVTPASTTTTLTSSPNPALDGQSVTVSYSVLPPAGDTLTPSGTVTVNASTGESCNGAAPSGSCVLTFTSAGTRTITASYNGDSNFMGSTSTGLAQRVLYEPAGTVCDGAPGHQILPPINADGSSVLKQGRKVPAQFRVCDINGVSVGTAGVVTSFYLTQIITGTVTANVEDVVDTNNPDTMVRWDPTNMEWIFNISTQNLSAGSTYIYTINLNDGTSIVFDYGLR